MQRIKFTEKEETVICSLYKKGNNTVIIANKFNTYNTSIRRVLLRNNIILRTQSEVQSSIKNNPFIDLTSEEVQYWLGFLAADGNVSDPKLKTKNGSRTHSYSVDLTTSEKDKEHLYKYATFIGNNIKMKRYLNKKYDTYTHNVRFYNKNIHMYLCSLGIKPRKSKTLKLLIPFTSHIIRGILDGDGCVHSLKNNKLYVEIFTGSEIFFHQLVNYLTSQLINTTGLFKKSFGAVRVCTQHEVLKLYKLLYSGSSVWLERKRNKFEQGSAIKKFIDENAANSGKS